MSRENFHLVCPVAPTATQKRLTINGFWHSADAPEARAQPPKDAIVSERAYGTAPPAGLEGAGLIVI